jgi:hypothetical protein
MGNRNDLSTMARKLLPMTYTFDIKDKVLAFRTGSFRAEKGSVLHSGIYNRETASTLAAGACLILLGFFFASRPPRSGIFFIVVLLLFVLFFLFFRTFVFPETFLQAVIDKGNNAVSIMRKVFFRMEKQLFTLTELEGIREDFKAVASENPDGIKIVEKIALQHGTVIPGFGTAAEFYTVEFEFKDAGSVMVFSSRDHSEAADVTRTFKNFIER